MCIHLFECRLTESHLKPSQLSCSYVACHCPIFLLQHKYIWCQHKRPIMSTQIPLSIDHMHASGFVASKLRLCADAQYESLALCVCKAA